MSPRKNNTLTVQRWAKLRIGGLYPGKVTQAGIEKPSNRLRIRIQNLAAAHLGRTHEIDLPLPVRPGNRVSLFLAACGIDATTAGAIVGLDDVVGATVGLRFRGSRADGSEEFDFEKVPGPLSDRSTSTDKPNKQGQDKAD
jgi:hypothetical protein